MDEPGATSGVRQPASRAQHTPRARDAKLLRPVNPRPRILHSYCSTPAIRPPVALRSRRGFPAPHHLVGGAIRPREGCSGTVHTWGQHSTCMYHASSTRRSKSTGSTARAPACQPASTATPTPSASTARRTGRLLRRVVRGDVPSGRSRSMSGFREVCLVSTGSCRLDASDHSCAGRLERQQTADRGKARDHADAADTVVERPWQHGRQTRRPWLRLSATWQASSARDSFCCRC